MSIQPKVIALGFFDGVHLGHGALLRRTVEEAKRRGVRSAVFTWAQPPKEVVTGVPVPLINSPEDRAWLAKSLYDIDDVIMVPFNKEMMTTSWEDFVTEILIKRYHAVHLVAGHDHRFGHKNQGTPELLKSKCAELGLGCDIIPEVTVGGITVSSTYIRRLVSLGQVERAMEYLGHPHILTQTVRHGRRIGHTIGIPTVNLVPPPHVLVPGDGVYIARVCLMDGSSYAAVTNVGTRPTVNNGSDLTVESWMLDFDGDLYGQSIRVEFYKRLRDEIRFDSLDALKAEIQRNADDAKQPLELKATEIAVEGISTPDYPLQKKRHSVEFLRTIQHLRPRTNLFSATFRVRSAAAYAIHKFFQDRGFVYAQTPIITASDCEGAGEMFQVTTLDLNNVPKTEDGQVDYSQDFFGKKTSLTVSGQLNAENFAMAFGNVYTFGPTFRAENSNTQRHAAEFWMVEPEMAFTDLNGYMDTAEDMIKYIIRYVMEQCPQEMDFFNQFVDKGLRERLEHVASSDFGRVSYTEAVDLLKKSGEKFDYPVEWGIDLQTEHERYLTEHIFKRPVFVTDYPKDIKAFYMRLNDDGKTVAAADCLVPGIGEIIGGSQREERLDVLEARIKELGMNPEDYKYYCDLRRYGSCRHAGYGLGFERMVMYLTGVNNIRDVELHPRTVGSADF